MIDYDVVVACGEAIENNARALVMPWIPHVQNRPGSRTLKELVQTDSSLARLDQQGRLLWYNLSTATQTRKVSSGSSSILQQRSHVGPFGSGRGARGAIPRH